MSESDRTQFRIRVYLPTGYTCTLQLYGKSTFNDLRNQCWNKKSKDFGCTKSEARFRLYTTDLFFNDNQTISYLVSVYPSFEGLGTVDRYSILLESPQEAGDKAMRDKMKVDGKKPIFWQGYLLKCSKPTGKGFWKKQYVVFQSQTLMLYSSQDEFSKGKKAHKWIAMGSIVPQLDHHSCKTANKKFPLVLDVPVGKGTKTGINVFAGDSEAVRRSFIEVINKCLFFKKSAMVLNILPLLYVNNMASTEGLFRIAGEASKIKLLQTQIDNGLIPNFQKLLNRDNIHNFTGLLKRQLRFMQNPIIPETHYEAFIDIGRQLTEDKRIEQLNFVIKSLASTNVVVLSELFRFLSYAIQFESQSKMGPINFAIVIGPNILRTEAELINPQKAIDDNKHMQTVIATMIAHYKQILPSQAELYEFDRMTNPKWRYGVIEAPQQHQQQQQIQRNKPAMKNAASAGNGSFGLFEMARNVQGDSSNNANLNNANSNPLRLQNNNSSNNRRSSRYGMGGKQLVSGASELKSVQLKKTTKPPKNISPASSESNTVDFRAVLKKSNKAPPIQNLSEDNKQSSGTFDFRAQMKKNKKAMSPKQQPQPQSIQIQNVHNDDLKAPEHELQPKSPPPNPIESMSSEERQRQKDNTHLLEIFQDFEDNMAQFDEEIDFKQSFAESIVSQIMELAENNKVLSAPKYSKQVESKCRLVINAAKAHSQALQQFNQMLQNMYSRMEDEFETKQNGGNNKGGNAAKPPNMMGVTAGGPDSGDGDMPSGGLPHANTYSFDGNDGDIELQEADTGSTGSKHKSTYSIDEIAAAVNSDIGAIARYQSMTQEPEKKVAKALYDYPGGYRSNELTFHRGTSLIITKEKEGWVYGHYELEPSLTGWFPKSYVKIISG